jgi:hypothetical protein
VFPQAEQRECFSHLMDNFAKRFSGESVGQMWHAARAYNKDVYEKHNDAVHACNFVAKDCWRQIINLSGGDLTSILTSCVIM